jgi:hypothetical protein
MLGNLVQYRIDVTIEYQDQSDLMHGAQALCKIGTEAGTYVCDESLQTDATGIHRDITVERLDKIRGWYDSVTPLLK